MTQSEKNAVLLVGAYERENFGDLLFLLQTQSYLEGIETVASAPFAGDMSQLLGQDVVAYGAAANERSYGAVWVVGGEVGGTSVTNAFRMSATEDDYAELLSLPRRLRAEHLERFSGLDARSSPYLPRMSSIERTRGAAMVINSVGLSGLRGLRGIRRDEAWEAVREASFISVRDRDSSELLGRHNITHVLAPDLVHTLPLSIARPQRQENLALVQVKQDVLSSFGTAEFAEVLARSASLRKFHLRLFSAGSARGHDSFELYQQVVEHFRRVAPDRSIDISEAALPLDKAREIASCGVWIGTSLHGLIISSSFDVPRVALELDKLVRYAATWDEPMPHGVELSDVDSAVDAALALATTAAASGRSMDLAKSADASARQGLAVVHGAGEDSAARAVVRSQQSELLLARRRSFRSRFWAMVDR